MLSARYFNARAGATLDEFPGVALEVDGRRTLAGRARSGGAVILTLQGNTVTLLLVGRRGGRTFRLGQRGGARHRRHGGGDRASQKGRTHSGLCGHVVSPKQVCGHAFTGHDHGTLPERQILQPTQSGMLIPAGRIAAP